MHSIHSSPSEDLFFSLPVRPECNDRRPTAFAIHLTKRHIMTTLLQSATDDRDYRQTTYRHTYRQTDRQTDRQTS